MFSTDLSTRSCDGRAVLALRGELDLADGAAVAVALTAVATREPRIIVDLTGLEFIDSSGVAALARGRRQAWQAMSLSSDPLGAPAARPARPAACPAARPADVWPSR